MGIVNWFTNDLSTEDLKTLQFEYFLRVYIATNKITDDKKIKEIDKMLGHEERRAEFKRTKEEVLRAAGRL